MAQLLREGLELPAGLTVLVGENGSGKSTVVESLAEAYGLNPQCGSALAQLWSQVVVATHSPVLAAIPGAYLLELGPWGMRPSAWEDLSRSSRGGISCATRVRISGTCSPGYDAIYDRGGP